jgi:hypothetical protein
MTSPDGITWTSRSSAVDNDWRSVIYGNGQFVAISNNGSGSQVMKSSSGITQPRVLGKNDGVVWATSTSAVDNAWSSVTYGNGLFVAVANSGTGNRVMTSPDGITWTSRTSAVDNGWVSITYGNGLFVAVSWTGTGNRVMTSPDGITWTSRTSAVDNQWRSVTYGNGLFVVVANTGTDDRVMTSPDGITWTSRTSASTVGNSWRSVTYGNGLFVAVASNTFEYDTVMTSPDGITWTSRTSAADNGWQSITYGNGLFVAVAGSGTGNRVMTSPDGINWTSRTSAADNQWMSVTYGNSLFVAVAYNGTGNRVMTSATGTTWAIASSTADNNWYGVTYGNGKFVAVSTTGTGNRVMTSNSGTFYNNPGLYQSVQKVEVTNDTGSIIYGEVNNPTTDTFSIPLTLSTLSATASTTQYKLRITPKSHALMSALGVGKEYVLTPRVLAFSGSEGQVDGEDAAGAVTTVDNVVNDSKVSGEVWTSRASGADNQFGFVTYGKGLFVALASCVSNQCVMTSPDGITWTQRNAAVNNSWQAVTYGNGLFVAVAGSGTGNRVMTSPDGITWTSRTSAADNQWNSVTYGNGLFVAVAGDASGNNVMTSPDGIAWTAHTVLDGDDPWTYVTYGNGLFVAIGSSWTGADHVMTSPDGITWTSRTAVGGNNWLSLAYGNGLFVIIDDYAFVMTSPDGITWTARSNAIVSDWRSMTYGNGLFVAVAYSGTGNRVMTSPDGIIWTSRGFNSGNAWTSITYGNGVFVAVAPHNDSYQSIENGIMTSSFITPSPTTNKISLTFTTPPDTDLSRALILQNVFQEQDTPVEGVSYATGTTFIGHGSYVACSFVVTSSTTYTCDATNVYNGTPDYFALYLRDTKGNYSQGVKLYTPVTPGLAITLGAGADVASTTLLPGGSATTSDTFTLQTDSGTDILKSLTLTMASGTAQALSLIEITNNAGTVVYGSTTNPATDIPTIILNTNTLTVTSSSTEYRVRITPKSHVNMPATPGAIYAVTSQVATITGTSVLNFNGSDLGATTTVVAIDNASPENVDVLGVKWRSRGSVANNDWTSVTYGNGIFVAVADSGTGRIAYSYDGVTWIPVTIQWEVYQLWKFVLFTNGKFIAVGNDANNNNKIVTVYSYDGINWNNDDPYLYVSNLSSLAYGNGIFVIVGCGAICGGGTNDILTSSDGINWTPRTSGINNFWPSISYGNGLFVAVGGCSLYCVMTSPDGITWTGHWTNFNSLGLYGRLNSITYGNGLFVTVANSIVATSPDGITWTSRTSAADNQWTSVTYGNGLFVAVSVDGTGNRVMTSPNGITWTIRASAADNQWQSVTYGNGLFVAVSNMFSGNISNRVMISSGITTTATSSKITLSYTTPTDTDPSSLIVLRATSTITTSPTEGLTYATSSSIGNATVVCSYTVIASSSYSCVDTSVTNGTQYYYKIFTRDTTGNWSTGAEPMITSITPGTKVVTLGSGVDGVGGVIALGSSATTSDTFTFKTDTGTDVIQSVTLSLATTTAQSLSLIEITNDAGSIVYGSIANPTTDILTIPLSNNTLTANTTKTQYRVRITPKSHVNMPAVPGSAYYLTSRVSSWKGTGASQAGMDGDATTTLLTIDNTSPQDVIVPAINWNTYSDNDGLNLIAYGNGLFVALSSNNNSIVKTSSDGITWTSHAAAVDNGWQSITYGNGLFVAVSWSGIGNRVMTSPDGVTWTSRTSAADNAWLSVTYGNGLFVAVACGSWCGSPNPYQLVMTSPDGINWTLQTTQDDIDWRSVTYGNSLFVAVSNSRVMTSPDGITWTTRDNGTKSSNLWNSVFYGNGLFIALANGISDNHSLMTSLDGIIWITRPVAANNWKDLVYGDGLFIAISCGTICSSDDPEHNIMLSVDGINWMSHATSKNSNWGNIAYGNGIFVATAAQDSDNIMIFSVTKTIATSSKITLSYTAPTDTDLSSLIVLRATSTITTSPTEGVTYATSSTVGNATVVCSYAVIASSTYSCADIGLSNGTLYYYKIFTRDSSGNWSIGAEPTTNPLSPGGKVITIGSGSDTLGGTILAGSSATTSDFFTFKTDTGTDTISTLTLQFATGTAQALSLVEITNATGSQVFGSATNPATDTLSITLATPLAISIATSTYAIRITPKSQVNMPSSPGALYAITSKVLSWSGTSAISGQDTSGTMLSLDNLSPYDTVTTSGTPGATGVVVGQEQIRLTFVTSTSTDISSVVVLYSTSPIVDRPQEGTTYTQGNVIGQSRVGCVITVSSPSSRQTCYLYGLSSKMSYHIKLFTQDTTGNYSVGVVPSASPYLTPSSLGRYYYETLESFSNATITPVTATTTQGNGSTSVEQNATNTVMTATTTPKKGSAGDGDVGLLHYQNGYAYTTANLPQVLGAFTTSCPTITNTMYYGVDNTISHGDVSTLQSFLKQHEYFTEDTTGFFRHYTEEAVKAYQRDNHLIVTGIVGKVTRDVMEKEICGE